MARGKFLTVEGPDGAGKSTHLAFIERVLLDRGKSVLVTREPGGTSLGERVREILLHAEDQPLCADSELLLVFAARMQHITEVIVPALGAGQYVLCDRFTDATYAYQGGGRGIADHRIAAIEEWVQAGLHPDLTLLLDVPVETGQARMANRDGTVDRFERENLAFKSAVRQAYLKRASDHPERIKLISADRTIEEIQKDLKISLDQFLDQ